MAQVEIRVGAHGRLVIPAHIRRLLGLVEGSTLFATVEGGRLVLEEPQAAARRARGSWRKFLPEGRDVVDELRAERRAEAVLEDAESAGGEAAITAARRALADLARRQIGR